MAEDGKTVCGASREGQKSKLDSVSAWVWEDGVTLGQLRTQEKSNEITAIPELLESLDICGASVTIDAMGCQTKIARKIVDLQDNYVLAVKRNQPNLYDAVEEYFRWAESDENEKKTLLRHSEYDGEHGRHVHWRVDVTHDAGWNEA